MKIIFTKHAEFRLEKRGISKEDAIFTIKNPDKTIKKHGKYYIQKKIERGNIEIVIEKKESFIKIITLYWL